MERVDQIYISGSNLYLDGVFYTSGSTTNINRLLYTRKFADDILINFSGNKDVSLITNELNTYNPTSTSADVYIAIIQNTFNFYHKSNVGGSVYDEDGDGEIDLSEEVAWGNISGNITNQTDLQNELDGKKDDFTEKTAFNKDFGTTSNTVSMGNHNHDTVYEPVNSNIQSHISNQTNPHVVTKSQIGLGAVNNTSDLDKPISNDTQTALNLKADKTNVLELDNTTSFTPDADYEPATKKYVDDSVDEPSVYFAHNNNAFSISSSFQTIPLNTVDIIDDSYSHNNNGEVTILKDGQYEIIYHADFEVASGSSRSTVVTKLQLNGSDVNGTQSTIYCRLKNYGTHGTATAILNLNENDVLKVIASRTVGTSSINTTVKGVSLNLKKIVAAGVIESNGNTTWGTIVGNISNQTDLQNELDGKKDDFAENSAFNKDFGTAASTVAEGNHNHNGVYEPANSNIQSHISNTNNPHNVNKSDVGLGNVDNTSDLNKPVSNAVANLLNNKADKNNVLELNNTTSFVPAADYEPATKKYVDDKLKDPDVFAARNTNDFTISSMNYQTVPFNVIDITGGGYTNSNGEITLDNAGQYEVNFHIDLVASAGTVDTSVKIMLQKNYTNIPGTENTLFIKKTQYGAVASYSYIFDLDDSDMLRIRAKVVDGSNTVKASGNGTSITIKKILIPSISGGTAENITWGDIIGDITNQTDLQNELAGKKDDFTENTAFNKNFGNNSGEVAEGNHNHDSDYEPKNTNIQSHISNTNNPHNVNKSDVGLGNVDNTSDLNKPISNDTQTALNLKANKNNVLELDNTASFTPASDYEPATKKYVDDSKEDPKVLSLYNNTDLALDGTWQKVPFNTVSATCSAYSVISAGTIEIQEAGQYEITYNVSIKGNSGNVRSEAASKLVINSNDVSGTYGELYMRQANFGSSASSSIIKNLQVNDVIEVHLMRTRGTAQIQALSGANTITIKKVLSPGASSNIAWGGITGIITNQTDLNTELNNKLEKSKNLLSKAIYLPAPVDTDLIPIWFTTKALKVNTVQAVVKDGSSVTFNIKSGTSVGTAINTIVNGQLVSSGLNGAEVTKSGIAINQNEYVWLEVTAVSGTVSYIHITIEYEIN